ncbi:hydantoinase/oxoprolinase family protein [Aliibacillus thermotolerans]|uniref:Hydantoinase/oxoprolinase family protein n=1 Tax=Aliibacillus thermotolerans TaxID=1834418 RepID=A0ABW0U237_9BACI|nr:hydantoinase/oxoprolinase family protein [Aliibacillus thermotolerans]MDA3128821.1 hydantoinase/oxoprolinase family protein [Aliibacillus thermotolerans]
MKNVRLAIDVGGTFTDVLLFDEVSGETLVTKTPSTPSQPEQGIMNGITKANIHSENIKVFSHGTTVGTNALIERKLPKTALITTKGFRDIPEIRRGTKQDLWDAYNDVTDPYIKRRDRFEVSERIDYAGRVLKEVNESEVKELARVLKKRKVEAIAIGFMNAYVNGKNEQKVKKILQQELPDVYICASSEILPEIFEHERLSTTIINAVLGPTVGNYISNLESRMKEIGYDKDILVLHSGGGVMTSKTVPHYASRLASSGIAAGAIASKYIAELCGFKNAIGLDMGGTSTDISLMYEGELRVTKDWYVEYGYPIGFPSIEVLTIGAGGGSISWIDEGGSLRNGPHSAGAEPGPACYDAGGTKPTNTDANLILGRLDSTLLDGQMILKKEKALQALQPICEQFGYTEYEAAHAILEVAHSNMCDALRLISVRRGYDPRDFVLVAFGGAGALHSAYLAKEMDIPHVIIPTHPGVGGALGCLLVDFRHDITKTYVTKIRDISVDDIEKEFLTMEKEAMKLLEKEGIEHENMHLIRHIEMRYAGQWRSLDITIGKPIFLDEAVNHFHKEHERAYAFSDPNVEVEIYGLSIEAVGVVRKPELKKEKPRGAIEDALKGYRNVFFKETGGFTETPIYRRTLIPVGVQIKGPAMIEQLDSTVVIPPEFIAKVDEYKNIIISIKK